MMEPVVEFEGVRVFHGDCREVLRELPDNSVDSIVTDPPYELGFMGKKWDSSGIAYDVTVWRECLRVLKPGGHLLAFGGSRTYHRLGVAIEDAGFEIRDTIAWISSKTFPKSLNVSKAIDKKLGAEREVVGTRLVPDQRGGRINSQDTIASGGVKKREVTVTQSATVEAQQWEGWGTGLKQVVEPVVMARKPLDGTVAENTLQWGLGGINIDGSRIGTDENLARPFGTPSDHVGQLKTLPPGKLNSPSALGRWPANVILDDVTAGLLDEQSGTVKGGTWNNTKGARYFNNNGDPTGFETSKVDKSEGGASRFFYVAKASKRDRNEGLEGLEGRDARNFAQDAWTRENMPFGEEPKKNFHPTVKPTALMRYLVKLVTPPGGVVLDPFTGSGSTGKAAILEGFQFVGIELTEDYLPIIEGRLRWARDNVDDGTLF